MEMAFIYIRKLSYCLSTKLGTIYLIAVTLFFGGEALYFLIFFE